MEFNCDTSNFKENESVQLAIRPEDIQFKQENSDDNILSAKIKEIDFFRILPKSFILNLKA